MGCEVCGSGVQFRSPAAGAASGTVGALTMVGRLGLIAPNRVMGSESLLAV